MPEEEDRRSQFSNRSHSSTFSVTTGSRRCKLYGRKVEEQDLLDAYHLATSPESTATSAKSGSQQPQQMVWISGDAGTGKTSLAQTLRQVVKRDEGFFCSGKFEAQFSDPYSVFVDAITEYINLLLAKKPQRLSSLRRRLHESIATPEDQQLLIAMIPALEHVFESGSCPTSDLSTASSVELGHQFHFLFGNFLHAILLDGPLVLFLDDLQYADASSLELLQSLCRNGSVGPLLIVGAHRTLSANDTRPFASTLGNPRMQWPGAESVQLRRISLENLDQDQVNDLVSGALELSPDKTESLASVLYEQTQGNALYVLYLLRFLSDQDWLYQDKDEEWQWDSDKVQTILDKENTAIDLIAGMIRTKLTEREQDVLKVASCLMAQEIDDSAVAVVVGSPSSTSKALESAEKGGFLAFVPHAGGYRFVHDHVQQAAFSLIPEQEQVAFQLDIGRKLWKASSSQGIKANIFIVVNLLETGKPLVTESKERYAIARLHLIAGEEAAAMSAFPDAAMYHTRGLEWLPGDSWKVDYELTLELHTAAAEMEVCNSHFENVRDLISIVFSKARCLGDKFRCYITLIVCMGQQGNIDEAQTVAFEVLEELGEVFPPRATKIIIAADLFKTKWALRGKSNKDLLSLPMMKDATKLAAGRVMALLFRYLYFSRSRYTPLVACRMIRLCLRYGRFNGFSSAFTFYAAIVSSVVGDFKTGLRYGQLAMTMLDNEPRRRYWLPLVLMSYYALISFYAYPLRDSLEPLQFASQTALETGNREISMLSGLMYCLHTYHAGLSVAAFEKAVSTYAHFMCAYKQENILLLLRPGHQLLFNLQGRSRDPSVLSGEVFDPKNAMTEAQHYGMDQMVVMGMCYMELEAAYLFLSFDRAIDVCVKVRRALEKQPPPAGFSFLKVQYLESLSLIASLHRMSPSKIPEARHRGIKKAARNKQMAMKFIYPTLKKIIEMAAIAPCNFEFRKHLLQAELASLKAKTSSKRSVSMNKEQITSLYEKSIQGAQQEGTLHEAAMACERAGDYVKRAGDGPGAEAFYRRARAIYDEWGAPAKVDQLDQGLLSHDHVN